MKLTQYMAVTVHKGRQKRIHTNILWKHKPAMTVNHTTFCVEIEMKIYWRVLKLHKVRNMTSSLQTVYSLSFVLLQCLLLALYLKNIKCWVLDTEPERRRIDQDMTTSSRWTPYCYQYKMANHNHKTIARSSCQLMISLHYKRVNIDFYLA